jgi:hypothetical protein
LRRDRERTIVSACEWDIGGDTKANGVDLFPFYSKVDNREICSRTPVRGENRVTAHSMNDILQIEACVSHCSYGTMPQENKSGSQVVIPPYSHGKSQDRIRHVPLSKMLLPIGCKHPPSFFSFFVLLICQALEVANWKGSHFLDFKFR